MWRKILSDNKMTARKYYVIYTIMFIFVAMGVFFYHLIYNKSFIFFSSRGIDGLLQHYDAFVYYGQYLRQIIKTMIIEHSFQIPMWDMSIGFGQDIINTLSYYVMGDPFSFLSVLCPTRYAEYLFDFLIILRLYFAGIAFSMYCRYHNKKNVNVMIGSYIYIFSAFTIYMVAKHPYFANPLIWCPLLCLAVDKVLKKEDFRGYIGLIALSALSNFYFFYMLCIVVVIYTVFRYVMIFKKIRIKELLFWIGKMMIFSLLGLGISMILFLPASMNIIMSSRITAQHYVPFLYPVSYYQEIFGSFMTGAKEASYCSTLGYTPIAVVAIILLFLRRKQEENQALFWGIILCTLFICIPYFGHLFNGMNYVTNRWIWAMTFLVSFITVHMMSQISSITSSELKKIIYVSIIYILICIMTDNIRIEKNMLAMLGLLCFIAIVYFFKKNKREDLFRIGSLMIVIISLWINAGYAYSPTEDNYISNYLDKSKALTTFVDDSPGKLLQDRKDISKVRIDTATMSLFDQRGNSSMLLHTNGSAFFFSTTNNATSDFVRDQYLNTSIEQTINNLDSRTYLDAILGVKYFVIPGMNQQYLPYGFNKIVKVNDLFAAYSSKYAFPLAFATNHYIPYKVYNRLSVTQKQQAFMQGLVVDHENNLSELSLNFTDEDIPYRVTEAKGVKLEHKKFKVTENNAQMTLEFTGMNQSETYLIFDKLDYRGINPITLYKKNDLENMTVYDRKRMEQRYENWRESNAVTIGISSDNVNKSINYKTWKFSFYGGKHNFLCNLGYSKNKKTKMILTFDKIGEYSFDQMRIVCQPMDDFKRQFKEITREKVKDIRINTNTISGKVNLKRDSMVAFLIPYSKGWSAYVDGQKVEIKKADEMFMSVPVEKGNHSIRLCYMTPYLKIGAVLSLISLMIFFVLNTIIIIDKKKSDSKCGK